MESSDQRRPREWARDLSYSSFFYLQLWKEYYDGRDHKTGTADIRVQHHTFKLIARDLFGDPNEAEIKACGDAFYWMPVKQAFNLTKWLLAGGAGEERHEIFGWLRTRAEEKGAS